MATAELRWDPFDRALHADPYRVWQRLRDDAPVYHNQQYDFYALSRFDDVLEASLDTETFSSEHGITLDAITDDPWDPPRAMIKIFSKPAPVEASPSGSKPNVGSRIATPGPPSISTSVPTSSAARIRPLFSDSTTTIGLLMSGSMRKPYSPRSTG